MHIHIPDGVLPVWIWALGFFLLFVLLIFSVLKVRKDSKRMPLAAMLTALALLVMSIPLGIPIHINLMVLIGILLGAYWSLVISFVANSILASFGHGGLTIIGLNTIVLWVQALLGIFFFLLFIRYLKMSKVISGGISAFLAVTLSFLLVIGIVSASNLNLEAAFHNDHEEHEKHHHEHHDEISVLAFILVTLPVVLWGAFAESIVTALGVGYIDKTRPDLIKHE